jgi:hypothetical protein
VTVGFDPNVLLGWYQAKTNLAVASLGRGAIAGGAGTAAAGQIPDAPWAAGTKQPAQNSLVTNALDGKAFINEKAAQIDVPNANADYKKLFAIYSGLQTLQALANAAGDPKTPSYQMTSIQQAFERGVGELNSYVGSAKFDEFRLTTGTVTSSAQTSMAIPTIDPIANKVMPSDSYTTEPIAANSTSAAVAAFQGNVVFDATVKDLNGGTTTVHFDFSDIVGTRSMSSVASYMNAQFKAAGVGTRVSVDTTTTKAQTMTIGGVTTTVAPAQDQYSFEFDGVGSEPITFSAPTTQAAVYVTSTAGNPALPAAPGSGAAAGTTTDDTQQQLLKLEAGDGTDAARRPNDSTYASSQVFSEKLPDGVSGVGATATGADGSVYMLANATGTVNGQAIKGSQDAVLLKYDSAGNLVYTRTLGAAASASGLSLAVSGTGQVAIAGAVTGDLDLGDSGAVANQSDSFVSLYDASGNEVWTQRQGADQADQATAVAFDASGNVYVAGQTTGSIGGGHAVGGKDGYLRAYSAAGKVLSTQQFGSSADDSVAGIVVNGSQVLVAGQDGASAMVRAFDVSNPAQMTLTASRNLGTLGGGSIEGIGLDGNGNLLIGGGTATSLNVGNTTLARAGSMDAFGAQISTDLTSTANDAVAYWGGGGSDKITAATVAGGKVWVAGTTQTALPNLPAIGTQDGFVAGLDVGAGTVAYSKRFTSTDQMDVPSTIAVDASGGSVLDRLGLPTGTIGSDTSQLVTSATSARAGDSFQIKAGNMPAQTVTISADDTVATLTKKIQSAGFFNVTIKQVDSGNGVKLQLVPETNMQTFTLIAGPEGHDALSALGMSPGLVRASVVDKTKGVIPADKGTQTYGLRLPTGLDLNNPADIKAAATALGNAITTTQSIYADLQKAAQPLSQQAQASGTVPAYITNQIADYQQALARLSGGSSDGSSSAGGTASLVSLFG